MADGGPVARDPTLPFLETARELLAIRTLPWLILASGLNALLTTGLINWMPAFMSRTHGVPANVFGPQMGIALLGGGMFGHLLGGPLADFLGRRDLRWYIWLLMGSGVIAASLNFAILAGPASMVVPLIGLTMLVGGLAAAPMMAVVAGLAPIRSRATAVAVLMVTIQVLGLGGGPVFVGWLSDMLHPIYGERSLGIAMRWALLVGAPSTVFAWLAAQSCRGDFAAAGGWDRSAAKSAMMH
jgi:MFS family permease